MSSMVSVVTGSNVGIGLETARGLAERGHTVVLACRDRGKAEAAQADIIASSGNDAVETVEIDLGSLASVRAAAADLGSRHPRIDVLVNNAGLILGDRRTTEDGFEATFGINHLGPFLLTHLLLPQLRAAAAARVVNVSSAGHQTSRGLDFEDLMVERRRYRELMVYGDSKLANILFTKELARRLGGTPHVAHAVHPGVVNTNFAADGDTGILGVAMRLIGFALLTPAKGARTSIHVATSDEAGRCSGEYWSRQRRTTPNRAARDPEAAVRLWEVSAELVGI